MTIQMSANDENAFGCASFMSSVNDMVSNILNYKTNPKYDMTIKVELKLKEPIDEIPEKEFKV